MEEIRLSDEPTIAISMRCLRCGGNGKEPDRSIASGQVRSTTIGGSCSKCAGKGFLAEQVTLKRLAELLQKPEDAERALFGSFIP
jgi:hypothetical protein